MIVDHALGHRRFYDLPQPYSNGRIVVYGDGCMGWYDYVLVDSSGCVEMRTSRQYGSAEIALRDALVEASP